MSEKPSGVATEGYLSGYFSSFFGLSGTRPAQINSTSALTPPASEINSAESNLFEPSTPSADDWTFGLFRCESREESRGGLQRNKTWGGFSLFGLGGMQKEPEVDVAAVIDQNQKTAEKVTWTFFNDKDKEKMASESSKAFDAVDQPSALDSTKVFDTVDRPPALDSTKAFDTVDRAADGMVKGTREGYQRGDIMSAYMAQESARLAAKEMSGVAAGSAVVEEMPVMSKKHRRSIFDNERIVVNRKEINMIAPNSM